jgi:biopolymer transport protein ExbD
MRLSRGRRRTRGIDISPLIDVVFQLLLFYAVTTQFVAEERLKLALPEAKTAEQQQGDKPRVAEVLVTAGGDIVVGGNRVREQDLEREIRRLVAGSPDKALTIRGDRGANYGAVVKVLDLARAAGAKAINMSAVKPADQPTGPR